MGVRTKLNGTFSFYKTWGKGRGCLIKKWTNILLHAAKMIDPRVKTQARGHNNRSRALKWGIVISVAQLLLEIQQVL